MSALEMQCKRFKNQDFEILLICHFEKTVKMLVTAVLKLKFNFVIRFRFVNNNVNNIIVKERDLTN